MTHQHTEAKNHFSEKEEPLTEPHYIFCGTPVEEHWFRFTVPPQSLLAHLQYTLIPEGVDQNWLSSFLLQFWAPPHSPYDLQNKQITSFWSLECNLR